MPTPENKFLALYVPVLHEGYLRLFRKYQGKVDTLYIFGQSLIDELKSLEKEIRAVEPETMRRLIEALEYFPRVVVLELQDAARFPSGTIITANETISQRFAEKYLSGRKVIFDELFLRWDEANVLSTHPVNYEKQSSSKSDRKFMTEAEKEREQSSCWWRQVGAVAVKDGEILLRAHNRHVPSELVHYAEGDPRDAIEAGKNTDLATTVHAEQAIIAEAAKRGVSLEGANLYLTVFPCPVCAKLIAYSGIGAVYFSTGHASLDGERILKDNDVSIILVK